MDIRTPGLLTSQEWPISGNFYNKEVSFVDALC
jgi:hypothetical protein